MLVLTVMTVELATLASAATAACHRLSSSPPSAAAAPNARACQVLQQRAIFLSARRHIALVLLGSALRNRGVQPLLDAVVDFLPSPPSPPSSVETSALAFKTVFDVKMGQELTYVRVYSGALAPKQSLYVSSSSSSSSSPVTERVSSIFRILADEVQPLQQVAPTPQILPLCNVQF